MDYIEDITVGKLALCLSASLITLVTVTIHLYGKHKYRYWEKRGLKGPRPWPVVGNLPEILMGNRLKTQRDWTQKYGKVYGVYYGFTPKLVIADPELVVQICIKDFEYFQNHEQQEFTNKTGQNFIFNLRDERWKRVRVLMSPTFTSGKIKRMFNLLDGCADDLVACFSEQIAANNQVVNAKDAYSLFTMDAITTCCYGLKFKRAGSVNLKMAASRDKLVEDAMRMFNFSIWRFFLAVAGPKSLLRSIGFKVQPANQLEPLVNKVKPIIENRRKSKQKVDDLLQLLIDAKLDAKLELDELDSVENHHAGLTHETLTNDQEKMLNDLSKGQDSALVKVQLTDAELLSNAVIMLAVGLETSGTLLCHASYALSFHQDIQQRLYEELSKIVEFDEDKSNARFQYESLTSCKYLDAVLSETLRLLSPVANMNRQANKDYHLDKLKLDLKAGDKVEINYHSLHTDPEFWSDPLAFNPDRFMPENKDKIVTGSYVPFGIGPRHCIGMRFSLTESKLALAKIVMRYKFEPAPGTNWPPTGRAFAILYNIAPPLVRCIDRRFIQ